MTDVIKKQRYYIYENISQLKNHNQIIDLINIHNCKYTENDNGIFLNLNTIEDKVITMIYHSMLNNINYKEENYDHNIYNLIEEDLETNNKNKDTSSYFKEEGLTFKDFPKKDHEIIEYSKKYDI